MNGWHKYGEEVKQKPATTQSVTKTTTGRKHTEHSTKRVTKKTTKTKKAAKSSDIFVIDTREPATMSRNFETFRVKYQLRTLKFGDYKLGYCLAERKTIFDFVASFRNSRVFTQLEGLTQEDCYPFLVIVGSMDMLKEDVHFKHIKENTVIGAIASCVCRYGVNVIWVHNDVEAVLVMTQLFGEISMGYKRPNGELPINFLMLPRSVSDLRKEGNKRKEIVKRIAEIICNERVCVFWANDTTVSLSVMSRMFHKINESKQGQPRKQMIKRDAGGRTANLVRNYLRVEPALAKSLIRSASAKGLGVMRYILETPNSTLLVHPGMGKVTLKRLRELVG